MDMSMLTETAFEVPGTKVKVPRWAVIGGGAALVVVLLLARRGASASAEAGQAEKSADESGGGATAYDDLINELVTNTPDLGIVEDPIYLGESGSSKRDGGSDPVVASDWIPLTLTPAWQPYPDLRTGELSRAPSKGVEKATSPQAGAYFIRRVDIAQTSTRVVSNPRGPAGVQAQTRTTPVVFTPGVVAVEGSKRSGPSRTVPAQTVVKKTPIVFTPRPPAYTYSERGR